VKYLIKFIYKVILYMNYINGYKTFEQTLSGINVITDGKAKIENGIIDCDKLYVGGVELVGNISSSSSINVGETLTLEPGLMAYVVNVGSEEQAILNFGIPQGLIGPEGKIGPVGLEGKMGLTGPEGKIGPVGPEGKIGLTGLEGKIGPVGPEGKIGLTGQGFIFQDEYGSLNGYVPYDVVTYNGSSYINILESLGHLPTDETYWRILAEKGGIGNTGPRGSSGSDGKNGSDGKDGRDGSDGSSVDIGSVIGAVVSAIGFAAIEGQVISLQTQMAIVESQVTTIQGEVAIHGGQIELLQSKTQNINATIGETNFSGNINLNNGVSNKISLNGNTGKIECDELEVLENINCQETIISNNIISNEGITSNGDIIINNSSLKIQSGESTNVLSEIDSSGNFNIYLGLEKITEIRNTGEVRCLNVACDEVACDELVCDELQTKDMVCNTIKPNNTFNQIIIGDVLGMITLNGYISMPQSGFNISNDGFLDQFNL